MFKKLRNRFLLMHMGMVSLLVVLFFGSILFLTYQSMEEGTDRRLDGFVRMRTQGVSVRAFDVGEHPDAFWSAAAGDTANEPSDDVRLYEITANIPPRGFKDEPVEPGIGIQMRVDRMTPGIFITMDENRRVAEVYDVFEMGEAFYTVAADTVISMEAAEASAGDGHAGSGKIRLDNMDMKYWVSGNEIALINITQESTVFYNMLRLMLMIALPLLLVIFFISMYFARSAIKPIEISYNRQKEFIADASHELKTPLTAISANLDVLDGTATAEQRQWVGYVKSEVERMSGLTNSLLYLTKMDHYHKNDGLTEINLGRLAEDHLLPQEAMLFEKGISLSVDVKQDAITRGDGEQLKRLVGILTDNAFRYASGSVEVKAEKIQNQAVLTIINDGPGIAPDEIKKVWERFYRSDKARLYDGGYGLGLPMAKAIVERHGGKISGESEPGVRTVFTVKLPIF